MSDFVVSIRLVGDLDDLETVARVADDFPERIPYRPLRRGELRGRRVQPANVLQIPLAAWERGGVSSSDDREAILAEERTQLAAAVAVVAQLAATLAALGRSRTSAELYVSTVRMEDWGGFDLPAELVAAAAAASLSIGLSIAVVVWPDDDDDDADDTREQEEMPKTT